jgi:hypothetical protein
MEPLAPELSMADQSSGSWFPSGWAALAGLARPYRAQVRALAP